MNFELVDNYIQVTVMGVAAVAALIGSFRYRDRRSLILAFAYSCLGMGTLFYVLHLAVTGETPQIFYVSEISWIAAYLFYLSFQIVRMEKIKVYFSGLPFLWAAVMASVILIDRMMGPSYLISGLFAATLAGIVYLTVFHLQSGSTPKKLDICFLICLVLQVALYISSEFIRDYTRFNLYFAIDFAMTGGEAAFLFLNLQEAKETKTQCTRLPDRSSDPADAAEHGQD